MKRLVPLEKEATMVANESAKPPLIFQLPPKKARERLNKAQDTPVYKCPAEIKKLPVETSKWGCVNVYFVIPVNIEGLPHVIYYLHGGGVGFREFPYT